MIYNYSFSVIAERCYSALAWIISIILIVLAKAGEAESGFTESHLRRGQVGWI